MTSGTSRVAIVAGVGEGVGTAMARALAAEGLSVVVAARSRSIIDDLAPQLATPSLAVPTDVTDGDSCEELVRRTLDRFGRIDAVVGNVGLIGSRTSVSESTIGEWTSLLDVNALGPLRLVRPALPALGVRRGGAVVFVGSMVLRSPRHLPGRGAYAASKAALSSIAQTLAEEVGSSGVRVNTVAPGWIWGPALVNGLARELAASSSRTLEEVHDELARSAPLRRLARPEDVADAVAFLVSDRAAAITGQTLHVNGGEVTS